MTLSLMNLNERCRRALSSELQIEEDRVVSRFEECPFSWIDLGDLSELDVQPPIILDRIMDGTSQGFGHLASFGKCAVNLMGRVITS
jgi:hypothetical protein